MFVIKDQNQVSCFHSVVNESVGVLLLVRCTIFDPDPADSPKFQGSQPGHQSHIRLGSCGLPCRLPRLPDVGSWLYLTLIDYVH